MPAINSVNCNNVNRVIRQLPLATSTKLFTYMNKMKVLGCTRRGRAKNPHIGHRAKQNLPKNKSRSQKQHPKHST